MKIDKIIPYSTQNINEDDIAAVVDVLRSNFVTQGPQIDAFESSINNYCGSPYSVAVTSATAGLHLALIAINISNDSLVWTSSMSFVSSANVARMLGAEIDFVDVEPETGNIDPNQLSEKLEFASNNNRLPDTLIVVHYSGRACDMESISSLCNKYDVAIIEDAAHALGAEYSNGDRVGSSHYSAATVFSFHPVKAITTGEGGMITTRDPTIADKSRLLRSHGITRNKEKFIGHNDGGDWFYEQQVLGYNYRITDIQAALGNSQMRRLDHFISKRRELSDIYHTKLAELPITLPPVDSKSAWHLYRIGINKNSRSSRLEVYNNLRAERIGVNIHYIPIHLQPYYTKLGFKRGAFPNCEHFYDTGISIPLHTQLSTDLQNYICEALSRALIR